MDMEQQTGSKLGKEYVKAVYCYPAYVTYAEYIMWNARLDEAQAAIKIAERNINNFRYANETIQTPTPSLFVENLSFIKRVPGAKTDGDWWSRERLLYEAGQHPLPGGSSYRRKRHPP